MARSLQAALSALTVEVRSCNPSALCSSELAPTTEAVRLLQRAVDALFLRIGARSDELASAGTAPDAVDTFLGTGDVSGRSARRIAERSRLVATVPAFKQALTSGQIDGEHLDIVSRAAKQLSAADRATLIADGGSKLAEVAGRLPVDTFATHIEKTINEIRGDHGKQTIARQRADSVFRHWTDQEGMGHFRGALDPIRFEILTTAVDQHMKTLVADQADTRSADPASRSGLSLDANLAAAALVDLVSHTVGGAGRAEISLVVDARTATSGPHQDTICETARGSIVPPETMDRFACHAAITKVIADPRSGRLNAGRRSRTATSTQWAVLRALYTSCAWYGCGRPIDWCQAHHIQTWQDLGDTDLDNLILLCSQHHHRVHEGRWSVRLSNDRTLDIVRPDGRLWKSTKPDRLASWLSRNRSKEPGDGSRLERSKPPLEHGP